MPERCARLNWTLSDQADHQADGRRFSRARIAFCLAAFPIPIPLPSMNVCTCICQMSRDEKRERLGPRPKAALAFHCYRNDGKTPWDESQKTWQTGQPQTGALESTFTRIYKASI